MAKRMSDDDVMDYVYSRVLGDLDGIEAKNMFDDEDTGLEDGTAVNAEPKSEESGGVKITVEPMTKSSQQSGKDTDTRRDGEPDEDDDEDKLKGISGYSPLMAQLHGER